MFRGSVKGTGYPLHSPVFSSLPLPGVTVCHHISTGVYSLKCAEVCCKKFEELLSLADFVRIPGDDSERIETYSSVSCDILVFGCCVSSFYSVNIIHNGTICQGHPLNTTWAIFIDCHRLFRCIFLQKLTVAYPLKIIRLSRNSKYNESSQQPTIETYHEPFELSTEPHIPCA